MNQPQAVPLNWAKPLFACLFTLALASPSAWALGLSIEAAAPMCSASPAPTLAPPPAAHERLAGSQAVAGSRNIAWAWLGSPTARYPHTALGSTEHAGSLHVLVGHGSAAHEVVYRLPTHRVFEDRVVRLVDLNGDGRDEIVVVEADAQRGAALVVLGVQEGTPPKLVELARSPHVGSSFRWLNPVGVADFDGDGRLDLASVTTPHIGGVLTLHHYRPPHLVAFATIGDVSNHRMGALEQRLAAVVTVPNQRPTVIVPDMTHRALHALRWDAPGQWKELPAPLALPGRVESLTPLADGACAHMADGKWQRVKLTP